MNTLPEAKRIALVKALCEGASIRAACRMTGVSKTTALKVLVEVGEFCAVYQDYRLRDLTTSRVEADELWAFVGAKAKNAKQQGHGDVWTFVAIDADTKLIASWLVGHRTPEHFEFFMRDLASRMSQRIQLTTDGHNFYLPAVAKAFEYDVDYAQLVKHYGSQHVDAKDATRRYSPPVCLGCTKTWVSGKPAKRLVSTSYVERTNLTIRMQSRRYTRLTNAFSKKMTNHAAAFALFSMHFNFCKSHGTLTKAKGGVHTSPAMASGLADHVWTVEEMLSLMDPKKPIVTA